MDIYYNTLVVLVGTTLLGMNAGLVGSFSVLRGRALLGDVLAHAALPGLCLAFLLLMRRNVVFMLLGALATCLLAVVLMALLRRFTRVKDDAVMGVIRSVFIGAGFVLISRLQNAATDGSKAGLESYILGKTAGMLRSDLVLMAGISAFSLILIVLLFKELRLAAFDPGFARVQGWPAGKLDILQMSLVALVTVAGLPAVGAVLVATMLILPGATMRLWTDRLGPLLLGAVIIGGCSGASGTLITARYSFPTGPIIILTGTAFFVVSLFCAPRRGILARVWADYQFRGELRQRKLLTTLFELGDSNRSTAGWSTLRELADALHWNRSEIVDVVAPAERVGLVERRIDGAIDDGQLRLTDEGRRRASRLVRGERLWAAYLEAYPDESRSTTTLDLDELEADIPTDVRSQLEAELRASGRYPSVDDGRSP